MSNLKVVLNSAGVRELLRSDEMKSVCEKIARDVLNRTGDGYDMDSRVGKNRVNAMVYAKTYQAKADNSKNNTILKALKGGGK